MAAQASRGYRRFVLASAAFLVAWRGADLLALGRPPAVALGLYGFVFHALFGKAYALVPSYFDRRLAFPRAPTLHVPLSVLGTLLLAGGRTAAGAFLWAGGVAVFLATLCWTVRDNPLGCETGTGAANAERRPVDRVANAFVPVALAWLALASWDRLAGVTALPVVVGTGAAATHLLAAGTAVLMVFAVGFRLLPRFLVARPPRPLVAVVLPAGALAPPLLAAGFGGGPLFRAGATVEAVAVVGFALAFGVLFVRSDRRRVGLYGVLAGTWCGVGGVLLGLWFAVGDPPVAGLVAAHYRLNLLGFLGLVVVGVAYQFYPPGVGSHPLVGDRTALASIAALAGGVVLAAVGHALSVGLLALAGDALTLVGAGTYASLLAAVFAERRGRR